MTADLALPAALLVGLVVGAWVCQPPRIFTRAFWYIDAEDDPALAAAENEADERRVAERAEFSAWVGRGWEG